MSRLICEICGGDVLLKEGNHFRCTNCGACYAPEQLKSTLRESEVIMPQAVAPQTESPMGAVKEKSSRRQRIANACKTAAPFVFLIVFLLVVIFTSLNTSQKGTAKNCVEDDIQRRLAENDITVSDIRFDFVEAVKFQTREEDTVGYFAYMDQPIKVLQDDGSLKQYESHWAHIAEDYVGEYDPEASVKWGYVLKGSFTATHPEYGENSVDFDYVYVDENNIWRAIRHDFTPSYDMLRRDLRNYLTVYLQTGYDIRPNPEIKITAIEKDAERGNVYTAYGWVTVRDKYDEAYTAKFQAEYRRWDYQLFFHREKVTVDIPSS